jgi:hypothetical protein
MFQLLSGSVLLAIGLAIFGFTILLGAFFLVRSPMSLFSPITFAGLVVLFLIPTLMYAYRTRWGTDSAARINFGSPVTSMTFLISEIFSAGPIFMVLAAQEFLKFMRLSRVDIQPISALLLWLFDEGGRAEFTEISLAFPGLNAVRVLPQLRDIPGIYWWPDEGRISLSEGLKTNLARLLRRAPGKRRSPFDQARHKPPPFTEPPPTVTDETIAWYATLNLPPFAKLQQVKVRYRKLAKIHHPDARARDGSDDNAASDEQMKRINEAYHNILNHSKNQAGSVG